MKYVSTRGRAAALEFADTLITGLAPDGGLYVPETYPSLSADTIADFAVQPYAQVAQTVIAPYVEGAIGETALRAMIEEAYATFRHEAVTPLEQIGPANWILELFHGPTLAFKDVAMQLLARLMDHLLKERNERATIIGATSGDTGGSAIEAFGGRERADIFILFPKGRVSPVQQRQMTTSTHGNVHTIAIEGDFDDCQALVKSLFADASFSARNRLCGVNSINWARIMAQVVYYFYAAARLGSPWRPISFTVPTGNFGDIFAGYVAKRMGLAIDRLVIASNQNDILPRTLETGRYEKEPVTTSISPSMDIQVSSNFERLLFEAGGRDGETVAACMQSLAQSGSFEVPRRWLQAIRGDFDAERASEAQTTDCIRNFFAATEILVDPHTAVGLAVAAKAQQRAAPMITLATAHPAKFPDAVEAATGKRPTTVALAQDLMERKERFAILANDATAIKRFIEERVGAAG